MAETEQQPQTESQEALEPKSSCTEAVEANEGDSHRSSERSSKNKTPPPEDKDINGPKECDQSTSAAAENNPPKQKEGGGGGGGIRGFFNASIDFLRRGISLDSGPRRNRQYYEELPLEEKRKLYTCGRGFLTVDMIETWEEFRKKLAPSKQKPEKPIYAPNPALNEKISLWRGDITKLEIDAIVNAANSSLLGEGGVDGAIHRAAGYSLKDECATLNGCDTGDAKLTSGHRLPAKYVLHTVGPINGSESKLRSCYERCLQLVLENNIRSVAFCCIATGVYGYPNDEAAHIALEITRKWLESHADKVDRIIFCVFFKIDYNIYSQLLQYYFPLEESGDGEGVNEGEKGEEGQAAEGEIMETLGGGLLSAIATGDEALPAAEGEEQLSPKIDGYVMVSGPPTKQKSFTERVQRVPFSESKPESDKKTEASNKAAGGVDEGTAGAASKDLDAERKQRRQVERRLEEEIARAERERRKAKEERVRATAAGQHLEHQIELTHQLQQQVEDQEQEIHQLDEVIHQRENRIQELELTTDQLQQQIEGQEQQIHQLEVVIHQRENHIQVLEKSVHQLQQQIEGRRQEVHQLGETIHQRENHIQELERSIAGLQEREGHMEELMRQKERQVANSDRMFQDILQRLLGQVPQSQPHWVVQRDEIQLTEEQLGAGGWAVVKVAVFRGQRVAAKCLHNQIISAHNVRLFTREMNMAAHARHPNLLQFIGATMDNNPIILTELMPTSLRRVLERGNPLSHRQLISIASDVARALNYLHLTSPNPIIHRDVSSANVLLKSSAGDSYEAKLSDYGSANFVRYATTVGPGNPLYSAPEVNDPKQHSPKMDVYSLGLLLVEMCSGELFDDYEELIHSRISADWPEMVAVIRPCIRQDPRRRPSAANIITQLEQL